MWVKQYSIVIVEKQNPKKWNLEKNETDFIGFYILNNIIKHKSKFMPGDYKGGDENGSWCQTCWFIMLAGATQLPKSGMDMVSSVCLERRFDRI